MPFENHGKHSVFLIFSLHFEYSRHVTHVNKQFASLPEGSYISAAISTPAVAEKQLWSTCEKRCARRGRRYRKELRMILRRLRFTPGLILLLFSGLNIFSQEIQHGAASSSAEAAEEQKADEAVMGPLPLDVDFIVAAMGGMCATALSAAEKNSEISGERTDAAKEQEGLPADVDFPADKTGASCSIDACDLVENTDLSAGSSRSSSADSSRNLTESAAPWIE